MSKKSLFNQPGVEQLVPGRDLPVAVKVTGRNLHAVGLLVSVSSETVKGRSGLGVHFEDDGSLSHILLVSDGTEQLRVNAGEYLLMGPDKAAIIAASKAEYEFYKTLAPLVVSVGAAFATLGSSIASAIGI
ncbi:hypothetical protein [Mycolicibacterium sphagni]|uniref:Uncharacterized protein n=1 Tax=Mycolicibacterium sphagni TaxID=1786 RepID=A0A255DRJ6_9MYCO|nr:hypothetical protein [Mycolicibacterium sphagni]OYN81710.1 hypothetical protein CG716_04965 [Mycolicibacterium sphagni]